MDIKTDVDSFRPPEYQSCNSFLTEWSMKATQSDNYLVKNADGITQGHIWGKIVKAAADLP